MGWPVGEYRGKRSQTAAALPLVKGVTHFDASSGAIGRPKSLGKGIQMNTETKGVFEVLDGYPEDFVAISAHGLVTHADYEQVMIPLLTKTANVYGKVKLLYVLGSDFDAVNAGSAWEDAKLGLLSMHDFDRIAIVTDIEWIHRAVKIFTPLICRPVGVFQTGETTVASAWLQGNHSRHLKGSGVDIPAG